MNGRTLVLGLGNPLRGDDGVGAAVIAVLGQEALPDGVDLLDGGMPGLETLLLWEGYRRVLIVDAARMGLAPGQWRRFSPAQGQLQRSESALQGTLHAAGLAEAIALAEALGVLPPELVIYGVEPQEMDWAPGLSPALVAAVPALRAAIVTEIEKPPADDSAPEASVFRVAC